MNNKAQRIIAAIEAAFAGVPIEDGISLGEAIVLDNYGTDEERQLARSQDELVDWRNIPDVTIERSSVSLAFLDAKGMRFHLPAFMRFALRHYQTSDSASIDYTISTLDYSPGAGTQIFDIKIENVPLEYRSLVEKMLGTPEEQEFMKTKLAGLHTYNTERLSLLTETQCDAVRDFLEFMASEADDRNARRALEQCWSKRGNGNQPGAAPDGDPAPRSGSWEATKEPPAAS